MSLQTRKEKLDFLQKKLKRKKYFAILLALFTLGVNAFAWFVFSTHSEFEYEGKVSSWDVELREGDHLVNDFIISVDMKPGMTDFEKHYEVNNHGEVQAKLSYEIESLKILGRTVDLTAVADPVTYLQTYYPFSIEVSSDKSIINSNDTAEFSVIVSWDFEDATKFYALNNIYDYDSTFKYYTLSGSTYTPSNVVDTNYIANRNSLYLEKDDADTYFGMKCGAYQDTSGLDCIEIKIYLSVEQNN